MVKFSKKKKKNKKIINLLHIFISSCFTGKKKLFLDLSHMFVNITITNFICSIGVTYFVETEKKKTKKTFGKVVRVIPFHLSPLHKNKTKLQCCFIRIKGHQNFGGHINQKRKKEGSYIYKNFLLGRSEERRVGKECA